MPRLILQRLGDWTYVQWLVPYHGIKVCSLREIDCCTGRFMLRVVAVLAKGLLGLILIALSAWGVLALRHAGPGDDHLRLGLAAGLAVGSLGLMIALASPRWRRSALAVHVGLLAGLFVWWSTLEPSNDRVWQDDVAVLSHATVEGDFVTVHNIRNADYRSENDYTVAYYDKRFDLRKLEGVDLLAVYWMGPAIAHIFLSFAFADGDHLAVSIETRKERGESYSTLKGFFGQYELYYVVADERDVIRLRTNFRKDPPEEVYLFRMRAPIENARRLFLDYVREINALKSRPEFYNTLTTNCTTNIWFHSRVNAGHPHFSWKILASGYVPEYLYELGRLDTRMPFEELRQLAHINARAHAADGAADFSQRIREYSNNPPAATIQGIPR